MFKSPSIFIAFLLFIPMLSLEQFHKDENEMIQPAHVAEEANITIDEWNVVMKEKVEHKTAEQLVEKLKNRYKGTRINDEDIIKYEFRDNPLKGNIDVLIQVRIPKNSRTSAEIVAVIEGGHWSKEVEETYLSLSMNICNEYFTNLKQTFTWMNAHDDAIMIKSLFTQNMTDILNLQHVNTHFDKTTKQTFIYGYSPKIKEKIIIEDIPTNVQIVIKDGHHKKTNLTIGTPIMIHEY